jgi:phosphatidylinositol glycan class M
MMQKVGGYNAVYLSAFALRALLLVLGLIVDANKSAFGSLSYTDIDYHVYLDAANHVYNGESPYARESYRYVFK